MDEEGVVLSGYDDTGDVEEGGRERDGEGVVFEGCGRDSFKAGEEDLGELSRFFGKVGGRGKDGEGGSLTWRRGDAEGGGGERRRREGGRLRGVARKFGDGGSLGEGCLGGGKDDLGARERRREAGLQDLGERREEGRGEGEGFGGGRGELDEEGVGLDGYDDGGGVEEGGREGDGERVVFDGDGREGFEAGEENFGESCRFFGEVSRGREGGGGNRRGGGKGRVGRGKGG